MVPVSQDEADDYIRSKIRLNHFFIFFYAD